MEEFILNFGANIKEFIGIENCFSISEILLNGKKDISSLSLGIPKEFEIFK